MDVTIGVIVVEDTVVAVVVIVTVVDGATVVVWGVSRHVHSCAMSLGCPDNILFHAEDAKLRGMDDVPTVADVTLRF